MNPFEMKKSQYKNKQKKYVLSMYQYILVCDTKVCTSSLKFYHAFCTQYIQSTYLFEKYVSGTYLG